MHPDDEYTAAEETAVERPLRPLTPEAPEDRYDPVALAIGFNKLDIE